MKNTKGMENTENMDNSEDKKNKKNADNKIVAEQKKRAIIAKKDIVIISAVLLVGFGLMAAWYVYNRPSAATNIYAEITHNNITETVYLGENRQFSLDAAPTVIFEIRNGEIAFVMSDCPDQICIHSGFLGRPGQTAACLPNGVIMFIVAGQHGHEHDDDDGFGDLDIFIH
ncbi:MAG: NusG domain II-containing protein [Defluviitaleaceae bacterium]|nr:NusG domain II-containing protein [Defluviitaleaceae bacterium]